MRRFRHPSRTCREQSKLCSRGRRTERTNRSSVTTPARGGGVGYPPAMLRLGMVILCSSFKTPLKAGFLRRRKRHYSAIRHWRSCPRSWLMKCAILLPAWNFLPGCWLNGRRRARRWVDHVQAGMRTLSATVNNVLHFHSLPKRSAPHRYGAGVEVGVDF